MIWKIGIWGAIACCCGAFLQRLFEPVELWEIGMCYALPLLLLGWLAQKWIHEADSWLDPRPYFSPNARWQQLTFWGFPLGERQRITPETMRRGDSMLPYILTSPSQQFSRQTLRELMREGMWELDGQQVGESFISKSITFTKRGGKKVATWLLLFFSSLRAAGKIALLLAFCVAGVWYFLPNRAQLEQITGNVQLKLRKSGENIEFIDAVNDLYVPLKRLPPALPLALIAQEDRHFYAWYHRGVSPQGLGRALFRLLTLRGGVTQGGSGITQQLAKNLFLSQRGGMLRKFREMIFAVKLEWYYDKETILEMYLNKIYFGPEAKIYGIEAASRAAFQKRAIDLNPYEAALLIQASPNPNAYHVKKHPELARTRAEALLKLVAARGTQQIGGRDVTLTARQVDQAIQRGIQPGKSALKRQELRYLFDWLEPQIKQSKYFDDLRGDFTVVTTLNAEMQIYAARAVENILTDDAQRKRRVSQAALVALAPDGAVRAIIGAREYAGEFSRATTSARQPGSAFKLFVYLAALQNGWQPDDMIQDTELVANGHAITNADGKYWGNITLTKALAGSRNPTAVRLLEKIGGAKVIELARKLGISTPLKDVPTLALGVSDVRLIELTAAYTALINNGVAVAPYGIVGVRTNGGNIRHWRRDEGGKRVISAKHVRQMTGMLRAVVSDPKGTGRGVNIGDHEIAAKTGTTSGSRDAWFVGFSAHLCAGVWVGNDYNTPMNGVSGGTLPAEMFSKFMTDTHKHLHFSPQPLP